MSILNENNGDIQNKKSSPDKIFEIYRKHNIGEMRSGISRLQSILFSMHDMAYVASLADTCIVLPAPIKYSRIGMHTDKLEKQYQEDRLFTAQNFAKNVNSYNKLSTKCDIRSQLFAKIREIYPDFARSMNSKVSSQDYQLYLSVLKKFKSAVSLIPEYTDQKSSSTLLIEKQDKIAEVVDSIDFTKACEIEDKFMISELDTFFKNLARVPQEKTRTLKKSTIIMPDGKKVSIIKLAEKAKADRTKRLEKYSSIYQIYDKLTKHPYIKIENHDER